MRKILSILLLVVMILGALTSCGVEAPPAIKEGRFNFSITYEHLGESTTVSGVYVCKYTGVSFTLEGANFTRDWEGHIEGIEHAEEIYNSTVLICKTEDGGEIFLDFDLGAAHMMGEPHLEEAVIEPGFFLEYSNEDHTSATLGGGSEEVEELYGYKIVDYKYDAPIKNTFSFFG